MWVRVLSGLPVLKGLAVLKHHPHCITTQVFIAKTVILELEWVLRAVYQPPATVIPQGMLKLLGLPKVVVEDRRQILQALSHYQQGMEFAEALPLAASPVPAEFYTFDQKWVTVAGRVNQAVVLVKD